MSDRVTDLYQWDRRPKLPARPSWFTSWPGGARIALQILVLNEWESWPRHRRRPMATDLQNKHDPQSKFDYLALGGREYGARHGIWRILDILDKHGVKATIPANGLTAEHFPDSVRASRERGHEVAAHQWDMVTFPPMFASKEDEKASLIRTVAALEKAGSGKIQGYLSPGPRPTPHTLDILAELGFLWTHDYADCDFPYLITGPGKPIVSISYATPGFTDGETSSHGAARGLEEIKYAFDATYAEAERHPMKFCYAIHPHVSGMIGMARLLDDFLDYARRRDGVWFPRAIDIANFWNSEGRG